MNNTNVRNLYYKINTLIKDKESLQAELDSYRLQGIKENNDRKLFADMLANESKRHEEEITALKAEISELRTRSYDLETLALGYRSTSDKFNGIERFDASLESELAAMQARRNAYNEDGCQ